MPWCRGIRLLQTPTTDSRKKPLTTLASCLEASVTAIALANAHGKLRSFTRRPEAEGEGRRRSRKPSERPSFLSRRPPRCPVLATRQAS